MSKPFRKTLTLLPVVRPSKFSKLALRKSASLFCCCCRDESILGSGLGDGGGTGIEFAKVGDSLFECGSLLLDNESKTAGKSTDGGLDGDLVGVGFVGGGCNGGAMLVDIVVSLGIEFDADVKIPGEAGTLIILEQETANMNSSVTKTPVPMESKSSIFTYSAMECRECTWAYCELEISLIEICKIDRPDSDNFAQLRI